MGCVYVFNGTLDQVVLYVSPSSGWTSLIPPLPGRPWTPNQIEVDRTDDPPSGTQFVNGVENGVIVQTPNGNAPEVQLPIPGAPTSTADLWLYVFYERMFLIDTHGWIRADITMQWPGPSEAEVALPP